MKNADQGKSSGEGSYTGSKQTSDSRLSSKVDWRPESGSPEPPGEVGKIPRPE